MSLSICFSYIYIYIYREREREGALTGNTKPDKKSKEATSVRKAKFSKIGAKKVQAKIATTA